MNENRKKEVEETTKEIVRLLEKKGRCGYSRMKRFFPTEKTSSTGKETPKFTNAHSPEDSTKNG